MYSPCSCGPASWNQMIFLMSITCPAGAEIPKEFCDPHWKIPRSFSSWVLWLYFLAEQI